MNQLIPYIINNQPFVLSFVLFSLPVMSDADIMPYGTNSGLRKQNLYFPVRQAAHMRYLF
jgi:hypothetical protein